MGLGKKWATVVCPNGFRLGKINKTQYAGFVIPRYMIRTALGFKIQSYKPGFIFRPSVQPIICVCVRVFYSSVMIRIVDWFAVLHI